MAPALLVLFLVAGWRIVTLYVPVLSNFSPVMALAFCAGAYGRGRWMRLAPFAGLVLSDLYIDRYYASVYHYGWDVPSALLRIACFGAALGLGLAVASRRNWVTLLGGALGGSLLFYVVTNTASWFSDAGYARSAAGWWQALTVGHPQYAPTLFFFRNSLVSDLLFTAGFALAVEYGRMRRGDPSLLGLKQVGR